MALRYQYLALVALILVTFLGALAFISPIPTSQYLSHGDPLGTSPASGLSVPRGMRVR